MIVVGVLPFTILLILFVFKIPIGQPDFRLRYSPLVALRIERSVIALVICVLGILALWGASRGVPFFVLRARSLRAIAISCFVALVWWTVFALPPPTGQLELEQHLFNLLSPSHEGAFIIEAQSVKSVREYVSRVFFEHLAKPPNEMRGRRVLSNPPGITALCVSLNDILEASPKMRKYAIDSFGLAKLGDSEQQGRFAAALCLAILMTIAWGLSFWPAFSLCRLWLSPTAAAAIAFACVFNPATVNFTPGKDTMQLFTVLCIMYFWIVGFSRRSDWRAFLCGVAVVVGLAIGLIHAWIFIIVCAATGFNAIRTNRDEVRGWARGLVSCGIGGAATALIFYLALDWNIMLTTYRVGMRYGQIQLPIITDPLYWTFLGLPLFLLFAGPCLWIELAAIRANVVNATARFGAILLVCATAVMTYSYFFANNSETVRLWIPFIPILLIGLAVRRSSLRLNTLSAEEDSTRDSIAMILLIVQLTVTLAMWTLMDVRESEWRLLTGRMWN
ncbi:MAG: hypothetical protein HYR83_03850 [Planctomycetes bacterium]|nr:hypothetical protein [Planctomycetota bacterium]